tara:strand:- start:1611 stop:1784 length:174 start_codon:yes stop_codon:yes gene_type:complete
LFYSGRVEGKNYKTLSAPPHHRKEEEGARRKRKRRKREGRKGRKDLLYSLYIITSIP